MSEATKPRSKKPFRVDLDGQIVTLPGKSLESMLGMFAHLESVALRRSKESFRAASGIKSLKTKPPMPKYQAFEEGNVEKVSFRELGRQVIRSSRGQIIALQQRAHEVQSLILINSWPVAEKLWGDLLPDCKTPLFELNFLEELWGIVPDQLDVGGWTLVRHWQQFVLIQAEIEVLLARRQSLMHLSDIVEGHLGLWLKRFEEILNKLDEYSAP